MIEASTISKVLDLPFNKERLAVSFSGGKDSLVALDLSIRAGIKKVIFIDTTIEFSETLEYIDDLSNFYNINIEKASAPRPFFDLINDMGLPSRRRRWCCEVFKFSPLMIYARKNKLEGYITGLRRDESTRRKNYSFIDSNPIMPIKQINPILDWTEKEVWDYIEKYELPINKLYNSFKRIGCWCCPFNSKEDWEMLNKKYPNKIEFLNTYLYRYANDVNIYDKDKFIKKRGWTKFIPNVKKININKYYLDENGHYCVKFQNNFKWIDNIKNLLPILTQDFIFEDNTLIVLQKDINIVKLNILIEKAINCIGCGACCAVCPTGALYISNNKLTLDLDNCTHCLRCLHTRILRGACIMRNFSYKRSSLIYNKPNK